LILQTQEEEMKNPRNLLAAVAAGAMVFSTAAYAQDWPQRPIEISVWASAGGATDMTNRFLAEAMSEALDARVNVVNRTGGGGGVAMEHVWSQPHDGHAWLGASEHMPIVPILQYHHTSLDDWHWYIVAGSQGVISVREDSPYQTLEDLVDAARENPGRINIGFCATGCVWHLKAMALESATDVDFNLLAFEGSAPAQTATMTGEVEAVVSGVAEQAEFIRAGQFRPLAMVRMNSYDFPDYGTIPAAGDNYPRVGDTAASQWLGMAIPADTPDEVVERINAAFEEARNHPRMRELEERHFTLIFQSGEEALERVLEEQRHLSWELYELGVAETDPSELGIERP
jgi:tripartite-type tricarboxylate transporter receptor subunit TctC